MCRRHIVDRWRYILVGSGHGPEAFEDRRTKVKTSMYIDLDVLDHFKSRSADDRPYQTQINLELRRIMEGEKADTDDAASSLRQAKGLIETALRKIK